MVSKVTMYIMVNMVSVNSRIIRLAPGGAGWSCSRHGHHGHHGQHGLQGLNVHLVLQSGDVLVKRDICRQGWSLFRRPAGTDIVMVGIMRMNLVLIATKGKSTKTIQSAIVTCLVMGK